MSWPRDRSPRWQSPQRGRHRSHVRSSIQRDIGASRASGSDFTATFAPGPTLRPARAGKQPGPRHLAFRVDDIDAAVAGLRAHGAELAGEVERYEDSCRLCYVRGPEGIIVELAEQIG
jgi:catechol 2,3-dioxygenase-like lactoylglutathione lyase family enzyme